MLSEPEWATASQGQAGSSTEAHGGTELAGGDTIPLRRDGTLHVVDVLPSREPDEDPVLVVRWA
jgi:hypothetical protein